MSFLTDYSSFPDEAYAGLIADDGPIDILTKRIADAAGIGFGLGVSYVASTSKADATLTNVGKTITDFLGVTVHEHIGPDDDASIVGGVGTLHKQKTNAPVMKRGRIWVVTFGAAIDVELPVFWNTNAGADNGKFHDTAAAGRVDISSKASWGTRVLNSLNIVVLDIHL